MHEILAIVGGQLRMGGRNRGVYLLRSVGVAMGGVIVAWFVLEDIGRRSLGGPAFGAQPGESFFRFANLQLLVLLVLGGRLGATTLSREREANTLPLILASGTAPRRIVLGLALGRWLPLLVGLAAGLPLALLLLQLGGITLRAALLAYLVTFAAFTLSLAVGSFYSSIARRTRTSILATSLTVVTFCLILPLLSWGIGAAGPLRSGLLWLSPFSTLAEVSSTPPEEALVLGHVATWLLGGVALVLLGAVLAHRSLGQGEVSSTTAALDRPPIEDYGRWPIWTVERARARTRSRKVVLGLSGLALVAGLGLAFVEDEGGLVLLALVGIGSLIVAWFSALFHATKGFTEERRTGAIHALAAAPVKGGMVMRSKALGVLTRLLPYALLHLGLCIVIPVAGFLLGADVGFIVLISVLFTLPASWLHIVMVTYLGLYFSLKSASEGRAVAYTLLMAIAMWFLMACVGSAMSIFGVLVPLVGAVVTALVVESQFDFILERVEDGRPRGAVTRRPGAPGPFAGATGGGPAGA